MECHGGRILARPFDPFQVGVRPDVTATDRLPARPDLAGVRALE
jgi:hypothetical protein